VFLVSPISAENMMSVPSTLIPMVSVPCKPRARLTEDQAVDVFKMRSPTSSAVNIARRYGVNEKTVRDIWKGRTWSTETSHLDTSRIVVLKQVGRPKGQTDKGPRNKRPITASTCFDPANLTQLTTLYCRQNLSGASSTPSTEGGADLMQQDQITTIAPLGPFYCTFAQTGIEETVSTYNQHEPQLPIGGFQVDEQLSSWTETLWISSSNPDPFRDDWAPMFCHAH
jgi:hypothetical protein